MEIKDYKQFLAEGGEIMHEDGTKVTDAHQWADGSWSFHYADGTSLGYQHSEIEDMHTFRANRERVKTFHFICMDGVIAGTDTQIENSAFVTITEKQEDGSWVIVETTLKPNA